MNRFDTSAHIHASYFNAQSIFTGTIIHNSHKHACYMSHLGPIDIIIHKTGTDQLTNPSKHSRSVSQENQKQIKMCQLLNWVPEYVRSLSSSHPLEQMIHDSHTSCSSNFLIE